MDEALAAIQDSGIAGLSLRDLSRRLGVNLGTVQHHFRTRDDLWRACVDRVAPDVMPADNAPPEPGRAIRQHLRAQLERATTRPAMTIAMWHDQGPGGEARQAYLIERCQPALEAARDQVQAAIAAGTVRPVDVDAVLALIGLGLSSLGNAREPLEKLFGIDLADTQARERFAADLADILLHGLLA